MNNDRSNIPFLRFFKHNWLAKTSFIIIIVYTFGFILWYSNTPLGFYPLLDGRENLVLANKIATGTLQNEPFYRAPFYAACIAIVEKIGVPQDNIPLCMQLFNGLCHLVSVFLVYKISIKLWNKPEAALLSMLLYGLNPVALHFAGDLLDITLAVTLLLGSLFYFFKSREPNSQHKFPVIAGLLIGIGVITRPHLLLVAVIIPVLLAFLDLRKAISSSLAVIAIIFLFGFTNLQVSGSFKLLPTQGAYNLWAANEPGSHGKYFSQHVIAKDPKNYINPARIQSLALYAKETGQQAPLDQDTVNQYWRRKTIKKILDDPVDWLKRMALKGYYLLNNHEQYNNKTFIVHKHLSHEFYGV